MSPTSQSAFFDFRQATQKLVMRSEAQQIRILKFELYCALDRAAALQAENAALEEEVGGLRAEVEHTIHELAITNHAREDEVQELRGQVRALEEQGAALEHLCQSLLDTAEAAPSSHEQDATTLPRVEPATHDPPPSGRSLVS